MEKIKIVLLTASSNPKLHFRDILFDDKNSTVEVIAIPHRDKQFAYQRLQGQTIKGVILDFPLHRHKVQTFNQITAQEPVAFTDEYEIYQFCLSRIR